MQSSAVVRTSSRGARRRRAAGSIDRSVDRGRLASLASRSGQCSGCLEPERRSAVPLEKIRQLGDRAAARLCEMARRGGVPPPILVPDLRAPSPPHQGRGLSVCLAASGRAAARGDVPSVRTDNPVASRKADCPRPAPGTAVCSFFGGASGSGVTSGRTVCGQFEECFRFADGWSKMSALHSLQVL